MRAATASIDPPIAPDDGLLRVGTLTYTRAALNRLFFWLLTADVVFVFMDQIEPRILPIVLKQHGASDQEIALIVSSTAALMQFLVTPILSYRSDRKRSPRGRRIPYILWATPFVSLLLAATPFAPELAERFLPSTSVNTWFTSAPVKPAILAFGILALAYRFFHAIVSPMFFALFRDVVPSSHMGRFLALFRMFGALGAFAITYWLVGLSEQHAKPIFIGVAVLNLVGFWIVCRFVREGEYPPSPETQLAEATSGRWWGAIAIFVRESFRQPIYWWTYGTRLLIYAAVPISGFMVFFPQRELGLPLDQVGRLMSWPALVWLAIAYPIGRAIDRWGSIRVLAVALALITVGYTASFFFVVGAMTFFVSALGTGILFWVIMLGQIALAQEVFNRDRYAQLSSANVLLQSLAIAFVISPLAGTLLDRLHSYHGVLTVPVVGEIALGPYRFVNLLLAALYGLSALCVVQVYRHWKKQGGAAGHYRAPL